MLGVGVGLALGVGLGANFALVGALGTKRVLAAMTSPQQLSARERFPQCTVSDDVPMHEELEWMLAQRQGRYPTPEWPVP